MITGYWVSQSIFVAAKLRIADHLSSGPKTAAELAVSTATHARSLYRLLRALASLGIFVEDNDGRFSHTPLSEALSSQKAGSQWALAIMMGEEQYHAWGDLSVPQMLPVITSRTTPSADGVGRRRVVISTRGSLYSPEAPGRSGSRRCFRPFSTMEQ